MFLGSGTLSGMSLCKVIRGRHQVHSRVQLTATNFCFISGYRKFYVCSWKKLTQTYNLASYPRAVGRKGINLMVCTHQLQVTHVGVSWQIAFSFYLCVCL